MKKTNALRLRQSVGAILKLLEKGGEPVLIERNGKPAAVLISLEDYQRRFVDRDADEKRRELVRSILGAGLRLPKGETSLSVLREGRR